ncbi:MAG: prenyltransferase/squalene oxidase repeat-containing protein [Nitrososphaerales archaeon]
MESWQRQLRFDPIPALLASSDEALQYFVRRDLLQENVGPVSRLWQLPQAQKILRKQQPDGSWDRAVSQKKHRAINYALIETWKQFRFLVEQYEFTREEPSTARAAEFLFSCQTEAGDIRGMLANQYANYYTGAIMSLLIKAGYEDDPRMEKGFQWLLSMRQDDMGWSEALVTHDFDRETIYRLTSQYAEPVAPDRSRPFSHNWTGMVLRAFAAHSRHRRSEPARIAAELLKSRFFQPDCYTSYQAASCWVRFQYPFWWNNLVAALDSISLIDPSRDEPMEKALDWLIAQQEKDGLWRTSYVTDKEANTLGTREMKPWVSLAICRVLSRMSCQDSPTFEELGEGGMIRRESGRNEALDPMW